MRTVFYQAEIMTQYCPDSAAAYHHQSSGFHSDIFYHRFARAVDDIYEQAGTWKVHYVFQAHFQHLQYTDTMIYFSFIFYLLCTYQVHLFVHGALYSRFVDYLLIFCTSSFVVFISDQYWNYLFFLPFALAILRCSSPSMLLLRGGRVVGNDDVR